MLTSAPRSASYKSDHSSSETHRPSASELLRYFVRLGTTGFGGPIALVGAMERELVERRRWVSDQELKDGLAFSQLAPGPLAAQLAIYLGWVCGGIRGATLAGLGFVGPSFVMVVALAALYAKFGGIAWLQGAFYGVGAAVIAIIARSAWRLARKTLARDRLGWFLFSLMAVVTAWREAEIVWVIVLCGVVSLSVKTRQQDSRALFASMSFPSLAVAVTTSSLTTTTTLFGYFASAGLFVFGSGLAIVPFLYGGVVQQHHWLTERQFLDAVAVALITPGPVVITVAFIGHLVGGLSGAFAAAAGVFAPVYVITIALAPHYDRLKQNARVRAFVDGVTAAATGAIAGAAFVLGKRAVIDWTTASIALGTLIMLATFRKIPEPAVVLVAGVVGILATTRG